jgi:NitT/TauT family transport system substrate-binding protein
MMLAKKSLLATATCAALALTLSACGGGSSSKVAAKNSAGEATVRIMVGGLNKQIYLPVMLAKSLGYYKAQGVNVQLSDEPAGVDAETAMLAGQVDAVVGFYDHNIDLQSKGKATESVAQLLQAPGEVEMVRTDEAAKIKSPADLRDRLMPADGSQTVLKVLSAFDPTVKGHTVDPSKTYTNDFVNKAK